MVYTHWVTLVALLAQSVLVWASGPRPGDIIFRRGTGVVSDAVSFASGPSTRWTHVGIVVQPRQGARLYVAHALDGRGVVLDPLEHFVSRSEAQTWSVVPLGPDVGFIASQAAKRYLGRRYDDEFDLADDSKVYCTELVIKSIEAAGVSVNPRRRTILGKSIVFPDDLERAIGYLSRVYGAGGKAVPLLHPPHRSATPPPL